MYTCFENHNKGIMQCNLADEKIKYQRELLHGKNEFVVL